MNPKYPFTSYRRVAYAFSALALAALAAATASRGGFRFGIDFAGGTTIQLRFFDALDASDVGKIRKALAPANLGENIRTAGSLTGEVEHAVEISVRGTGRVTGEEIESLVASVYPPVGPSDAIFDVNRSFSVDALAEDLARARLAVAAERIEAERNATGETSYASAAAFVRSAGLPPDLAAYLEANLSRDTTPLRTTLASPTREILDLLLPPLAERYRRVAAEVYAAREARGGFFASADEAAEAARAVGGPTAEEAALLFSRASASRFVVAGTETVGPTIGATLKRQAAWAVLFSLLGILAYLWLRFELRYSVGAIVALAHDSLFMILFIGAIGHDFSIPVIAAVLTVIGYSVNDTIVVFDRIRERMGMLTKSAPADVIDLAITETLSRTLRTSGTTLLSVLAFLVLGPEVLQDFSLVLFTGILVGTYSSIFVASPLLLEWDALLAARGGAQAAGGRGPLRGAGGSDRRR